MSTPPAASPLFTGAVPMFTNIHPTEAHWTNLFSRLRIEEKRVRREKKVRFRLDSEMSIKYPRSGPSSEQHTLGREASRHDGDMDAAREPSLLVQYEREAIRRRHPFTQSGNTMDGESLSRTSLRRFRRGLVHPDGRQRKYGTLRTRDRVEEKVRVVAAAHGNPDLTQQHSASQPHLPPVPDAIPSRHALSFRRAPDANDNASVARLDEVRHHSHLTEHLPFQFNTGLNLRRNSFEGEMADVDSRGPRDDGDRRGGGGGGGRQHFNNRKRRFREDDDMDRRGPPRRRFRDSPTASVRRQLNTIAENPMQDLDQAINSIVETIIEGARDTIFLGNLPDLIRILVCEQPFKIPFVAAVIVRLDRSHSDIVADIMTKIAAEANTHIAAGHWREFKLLLRCLACLQAIFTEQGIFPVLNDLFNRAADLQTASQEDSIGLELVKIILLTIPYVLVARPEDAQEALDLLEKTDIIASAPHNVFQLIDAYPAAAGDSEPKAMACESFIQLLQRQLQNEAAKDWAFSVIPKFFQRQKNEQNGEATLAKHEFPSLTIPDVVVPGPKAVFPEVFFSLYADQELESVPKTSDIASSIFRDNIVDIIDALDFNRNAVAKNLIELDCFYPAGTLVKRGTPVDKLRDIAEAGKSTWKAEDLLIDGVFSQVFKLPTPEHKLVYYNSIITEACKLAPSAVAPSLGRAIRFLYRNVQHMDLELSMRLIDWFAYHLSNFEFRWKWAEWEDDVTRSDLDPRKSFIIAALDKEIRLSFAVRIRRTLPEAYHGLIPTSKEKETPDFKYADPEMPFANEAKAIVSVLRKKGPDEQIQPEIDSIQASAHELASQRDPLLVSTDVLVTCICYAGAKSLSHVLSCIERCKDRLVANGQQTDLARQQMITSVMDYWTEHKGVAVNIVDKLLNYGALHPRDVIEWCLGERLQEHAARPLADAWIYEMVSNTLAKVANRVRQIVLARCQKGIPEETRVIIDSTLEKERNDLRDLMQYVRDAVAPVASGTQDGMMDADDDANRAANAWMQSWGRRWTRVVERKALVEEGAVGEAAVALAVQMAALKQAAEEERRVKAEAEKVAKEKEKAEKAAAMNSTTAEVEPAQLRAADGDVNGDTAMNGTVNHAATGVEADVID